MKSKLLNLGWLSIEEGLRLVGGLVVTVIVARELGPEGFGAYAYVISFVTLLGPLARFGLEAHVSREAASTQESEGAFNVSLAASVLTTAIAVSLTVLAYWGSDNPPGVGPGLLLAALPILLLAPLDLLAAFLKGRERMRELALTRMAASTIYLVVFAIILVQAPSTRNFVMLRSVEVALLAVAALAAFLYIGGAPWRRINIRKIRETLIDAFPLMLALFFGIALLRADQVLLGQLSNDDTLGQYAVAARIFEIGIIAPSVLQSTVFASMVRNHQSVDDGLSVYMQSVFDTFSLAGWITAIGFGICGALIMRPVFGSAYADALPMLNILLLGMPFYFLFFALNTELMAIGRYWIAAFLPAVGGLTNVTLNLLVIPPFGGEGAAWASVLSYFVAGIGGSLMISRLQPSGRKMLLALNPVSAARRLLTIYAHRPKMNPKAN